MRTFLIMWLVWFGSFLEKQYGKLDMPNGMIVLVVIGFILAVAQDFAEIKYKYERDK